MQELWQRLLIVGFGEVDEGAFPSLALGATRWIFEDLYQESQDLSTEDAEEEISRYFEAAPLVKRYHQRCLGQLATMKN